MAVLTHSVGAMESWFVMVPMWQKQRLIDRYGTLEEALRQERQNTLLLAGTGMAIYHCVGVHFCTDWQDPGERYLWDGSRVDAD